MGGPYYGEGEGRGYPRDGGGALGPHRLGGGDPRVPVMEERGRGTPGIKGDHICASLSLMGPPKGEGRDGLGGG